LASVAAGCERGAHAQSAGLNGLDPDRAGRIANVPVAHGATSIAPAVLHQSQEEPVRPAATVALAPPPPGVIDGKRLESEIAAQLEPLEQCRIDVARAKQLRADAVAADRLTLRWTIELTGKVHAPEVVGTTAVDADILGCVKHQMSGWTFSPPSGGPLPVERAFSFDQHRGARSAPPPAPRPRAK
jgi:hypothetical protein